MQGLVHLLKKILEIERMSQEQMTAQIYFILGLVVKAIRVALTVSVSPLDGKGLCALSLQCGFEEIVSVCALYVGDVTLKVVAQETQRSRS